MAIYIKLFSVNYFYWYGTTFTYLPDPKMNWIKQFVRFTDTGHIATILPIIFPAILPVAHNIHFIIMSGYWIGKFAFNMKDADKLETTDIVEWHIDLCTYIHHTVPYSFLYLLWKEQVTIKNIVCHIEYSNETL